MATSGPYTVTPMSAGASSFFTGFCFLPSSFFSFSLTTAVSSSVLGAGSSAFSGSAFSSGSSPPEITSVMFSFLVSISVFLTAGSAGFSSALGSSAGSSPLAADSAWPSAGFSSVSGASLLSSSLAAGSSSPPEIVRVMFSFFVSMTLAGAVATSSGWAAGSSSATAKSSSGRSAAPSSVMVAALASGAVSVMMKLHLALTSCSLPSSSLQA